MVDGVPFLKKDYGVWGHGSQQQADSSRLSPRSGSSHDARGVAPLAEQSLRQHPVDALRAIDELGDT